MDKQEFDKMFDQVFEEAVRESDPTPTDADIEASWKRVEQRLRQEKRKRHSISSSPVRFQQVLQ